MATEIKKGLICTDEDKTKGIYPYTSFDCVFDSNGNSLESYNLDRLVFTYYSQVYTINGNTDTTIYLNVSANAKAIIPYGYNVDSDWNTRLIFKGVPVLTTGQLAVRTVGGTPQNYRVFYLVVSA